MELLYHSTLLLPAPPLSFQHCSILPFLYHSTLLLPAPPLSSILHMLLPAPPLSFHFCFSLPLLSHSSNSSLLPFSFRPVHPKTIIFHECEYYSKANPDLHPDVNVVLADHWDSVGLGSSASICM
jgi:hypothetical protein